MCEWKGSDDGYGDGGGGGRGETLVTNGKLTNGKLTYHFSFVDLSETISISRRLPMFKPWSKKISHCTGSTSMLLRIVWQLQQRVTSLKKV